MENESNGIYFFGGIDSKGGMNNLIRVLKVSQYHGQITKGEWRSIESESSGKPPCARIGHTMNFLPILKALIVIGGRNDDLGKSEGTPFLNDVFLFHIDKKTWVELKYTNQSHKLERISNHTTTVVTNYENYEKVLIYGGV